MTMPTSGTICQFEGLYFTWPTREQNSKSSLSHSRDILGGQKFKMGHLMWPCPFQRLFVIRRLGLAVINLHTTFEVSMFTHYEDKKGNAKFRNWDGLEGYGSPKVTGNVTIR